MEMDVARDKDGSTSNHLPVFLMHQIVQRIFQCQQRSWVQVSSTTKTIQSTSKHDP